MNAVLKVASEESHARTPGLGQPENAARDALLIAGLITVAFVVGFAPVLRTLIRQWSENDTYSFGFLVPFISVYLIWRRRTPLQLLPVVPSYSAGAAIVVSAAILLVLGRLSAIVAFQEISLLLMIVGLVLLVIGRQFLRALWFPLAYLLLMLPVWEIVTDRMTGPLQLFSAWLGTALLRAVGIPAYRDLTYVTLPNITLEVARTCSGVSYLIAVFAIGVPLAYLFLRGWAPRLGLIAFALGIAVIGNGLRVALIGIFAQYGLSESLHGPGHIFTGVFVSYVGFVAVFSGLGVLARRYPRLVEPALQPARRTHWQGAARRKVLQAGLGASAMLVFLATIHPEYSAGAAALDRYQFPAVPGSWRTVAAGVSTPFIKNASPDGPFSRVYEAPTGERVALFVESLTYTDPNAGLSYRTVQIPRNPVNVTVRTDGGRSVRVNRVVIPNGDRETHVVFWYHLDGRVTAERKIAKGYTALQLITARLPPAKLVMVISELVRDRANNEELVSSFVRRVLAASPR